MESSLPRREPALEQSIRARLAEAMPLDMCTLEAYGSLPSTNAFVRVRAEAGAAEGLAVLAARQSAGRGRRGRSFYSPEGTGLYLSVLLRPSGSVWHGARITTLAAVAVCEAIEETAGVLPGIKWVNDLLLGEKKICGILAEAATGGCAESGAAGGESALRYVVLGIGVNLCPPPGGFPPELADIAGSLYPAPREGALPQLAAGILAHFFRRYRANDRAADMDAYRRRCLALGRRVSVLLPSGARAAFAYDVDCDGRLLVRYDDGTEAALSSGEISIGRHTLPAAHSPLA